MILFRNATANDVDAIHNLALHGGFGMTTLPKDMETLQKRLDWSTLSFSKTVNKPLNEYYMFVLEDTETKQIAGTSAIEASTGFETPFYSYKLSKRTRICHSMGIRSDYEVLNLVNDNQGLSEVCTLFLEPDFRVNGNGLLLSRARFLFMAQFPQRFAPRIMADMRGISDEEGNSPFWNNVGCHFFQMSFADADRLTTATNKQFIADLMPRNPLYVALLAPEAQAVIGKPHHSTVPAMNILLREGFQFNGYIDIFDGGPTIEAPCQQIHTIAASRVLPVTSISDDISSSRFLLANDHIDFRATIGQVIINEKKSACTISKETAAVLQIKKEEHIRIVPLQIKPDNLFNEGPS